MSDWASTIDWAYRLIVLIGGGAVLVWMGRAISAQEKTIKAQSEKMESMQKLLTMMDTVLKSIDEQTMLARLKAHKEFVEHEKDMLTAQVKTELEQQRNVIDGAHKLVRQLVVLLANVVPYVPMARRDEFFSGIGSSALRTIAQIAPDLSVSGRTSPSGEA